MCSALRAADVAMLPSTMDRHSAPDALLDKVFALAETAAKLARDGPTLTSRLRSEVASEASSDMGLDESMACATFGELRQSSTKMLFSVLCGFQDPTLRLGSLSHFVDLGSGFGLPVFGALAQSPARIATGIELIGSRHRVSLNILEDADVQRLLPSGAIVNFVHGDVTKQDVWQQTNFSHVFTFDAAFTEETCEAIARALLSQPTWKVFISSRSVKYWADHGLEDIALLASFAVTMRVSGEKRTLYAFKRLASGYLELLASQLEADCASKDSGIMPLISLAAGCRVKCRRRSTTRGAMTTNTPTKQARRKHQGARVQGQFSCSWVRVLRCRGTLLKRTVSVQLNNARFCLCR
jgi:hypothetical protein